MKKSIRLLIWIMSFTIMNSFLLDRAINYFPKTLPPNIGMLSLYSFDQRVSDSRRDVKGKRKIIVGQSYAWLLGTPHGCCNLGMTGATFNEVRAIIKAYCTPEDQIIYPINMVQLSGGDIRPELTSWLLRHLTLDRSRLRYSLGLDKEKYDIHPLEILYSRNIDSQLSEVQEMRSIILGKHDLLESLGVIENYKRAKLANVDFTKVDHYVQLKKEFPNITYVFLPILPAPNKRSSNEDFNVQVKLMREEERIFLENLKKSDLQPLDLSGILSERDYLDIIHQNKQGIEKIVKTLDDEGFFNN